ncbi:MAG: PAS domain S-box protein [Ignavibacteria bacterium]|nr:PAS domain S-box protein [Ignavibacteria bacterium]
MKNNFFRIIRDLLTPKSSIVIIFIFMLVAILATVGIRHTWNRVERHNSEEAIQAAIIAASALSGEMVKKLNAIPGDTATIAYQSIKQHLVKIKSVINNARFAYLFTKKEGKIYFIADSEPVDSKDYSPPGQEYTEVDTNYVKLFESGKEFITPPITDRWGTWVSVLVPVIDETTGRTVAAFGMDYEADRWKSSIVLGVFRASLVVVIAFLLLIFLLIKLVLKNKILNTEAAERRHAEEKLRESETKTRTILESISTGIMIIDPETHTIVDVNAEAIRLIGEPKENIVSSVCHQFICPAEIDKCPVTDLRQLIDNSERILIGKEGIRIPILKSVKKINWGGRMLLLENFTVITERKRAEEKLKSSEEQYRTLFENVPIGIGVSDLKGKLITFNDAMLKPGGYSRDEIISIESVENLYYDLADRERVISLIKEKGFVHQFPIQFKRKDGSPYDTLLTLSIIHFKNQPMIQALVEDITERKKAEMIIEKTNKELINLNAEKDKFFSIIAHDLRSPFHGFLSMTEMMADSREEISQADLVEYSKKLNRAANNLYKLLENLLAWAQVKNGSIDFAPINFDLSMIVFQNIDTLNQQAQQKGITIINEIEHGQKVYADEKMVGSVLRNLLSNAVKFTKKDGIITLKANAASNDMIEIAVEDTGIGISERLVNKLFKLDEKVGRKGTEGESSTGLGLLLCKEFVEKHGGKIWVESEEGKGSTFTFSLPKKDN